MGRSIKSHVRRNAVLTFILVALGLQLALVLVILALVPAGKQLHDCAALRVIHRAGFLGPLVISIAITAWIDGGVGLRKLFVDLRRWRVPAKWYLFAITWKFLFILAGMVVVWAMGAAVGPGRSSWNISGDPINIVLAACAAIVEVTAWIKFCLPRSQERHSSLLSCAIIGAGWCLWHLPALLLGEGVPYDIPWWSFLVGMFSLAVLLGWAYNVTRSGLVPVIMHFTGSIAFSMVPALSNTRVGPVFVEVVVAMTFAAAGFVILWYGPRQLADGACVRWNDPVLRPVHVRDRDPEDGALAAQRA